MDKNTVTTAFITKYWATKGIFEIQVELKEGKDYASPLDENYKHTLFFKNQFRLTREDAVKYVEQLRKNQIDYLKRKITKLEKMIF